LKINWGVGITIVIVLFSVITLAFVYFAFTQEVNLVRDDYYQAEVQFNEKLETIKRTEKLSEDVKINVLKNNIEIIFPKFLETEDISGTVFLYRPSDRNLDFNFPIKLDSSNTQLIATNKIMPGHWKIDIEWNIDTNLYFSNKTLMVQ
jgi:nitrogen fixation protein FixH